MTEAYDCDGNRIKVGDDVNFKCDIEQWGVVKAIQPNGMLVLTNSRGFKGDYIGGATETLQPANRCWKTE